MDLHDRRMPRRTFLKRASALTAAAALGGERADAQEGVGDYDAITDLIRTPHKYGRLVLAPSYEEGAFDELAIDCPVPFCHQGKYYMLHLGFDGTGYQTGLASSDDLLHWRKEGLVLGRGPKGSITEYNTALCWVVRENELTGSGRLKKVDGKYLGVYHAYPKPGYESGPAVCGLCWTEDLRSWQVDEPFLSASDPDAGPWEAGGLYKMCLVEHQNRWYAFYNAKTSTHPWVEQTGLVISDDLKTWRRHAANPVIPNGPKRSIDEIFASDPYVLKHHDAWVMFYYTLSADHKARDTVAFSRDLLSWHKTNQILIDVGPPGTVDSRYAHKPGIIHKDGVLYHFYCAVAPKTHPEEGSPKYGEIRGISVATSRKVWE